MQFRSSRVAARMRIRGDGETSSTFKARGFERQKVAEKHSRLSALRRTLCARHCGGRQRRHKARRRRCLRWRVEVAQAYAHTKSQSQRQCAPLIIGTRSGTRRHAEGKGREHDLAETRQGGRWSRRRRRRRRTREQHGSAREEASGGQKRKRAEQSAGEERRREERSADAL